MVVGGGQSQQGAGTNILSGIASSSARDSWAVGFTVSSSGTVKTLTEHWNGARGSVIPSANATSTVNHLNGVTVVSPANV